MLLRLGGTGGENLATAEVQQLQRSRVQISVAAATVAASCLVSSCA